MFFVLRILRPPRAESLDEMALAEAADAVMVVLDAAAVPPIVAMLMLGCARQPGKWKCRSHLWSENLRAPCPTPTATSGTA